MSDSLSTEPGLDLGHLRQAIQEEYTAVARDPGRGYHFHTGRPLASLLGYDDGWADVVISNGVLNLLPDKLAALREMARVLKPAGRLQIGDILVRAAVPADAKQQIDLWTG
jgi:ubiquinone/menaquinone biosynthesis C-methylase UbiE